MLSPWCWNGRAAKGQDTGGEGGGGGGRQGGDRQGLGAAVGRLLPRTPLEQMRGGGGEGVPWFGSALRSSAAWEWGKRPRVWCCNASRLGFCIPQPRQTARPAGSKRALAPVCLYLIVLVWPPRAEAAAAAAGADPHGSGFPQPQAAGNCSSPSLRPAPQ